MLASWMGYISLEDSNKTFDLVAVALPRLRCKRKGVAAVKNPPLLHYQLRSQDLRIGDLVEYVELSLIHI